MYHIPTVPYFYIEASPHRPIGMRACCGQQDACIRIHVCADASLARSFFPCPVASLCQSAPCNFLAAADQACMLGKTSRISKCTMRGLEISSWSKMQHARAPPTMHAMPWHAIQLCTIYKPLIPCNICPTVLAWRVNSY